MMMMQKNQRMLLCAILLLPAVAAFWSPGHQALTGRSPVRETSTTARSLMVDVSSITDNALLMADTTLDPKAVAAASAAAGVPDATSLFNFNLGEMAQKIAVGFTALVFLFVGLTSLVGAILIPAGAEQLEIECKALIPSVWDEYMEQLEDGQTIKDRPDLMFQLGLLLNKCKADRLKEVCVDAKLAPELWDEVQAKLLDDQELQDRPELIAELQIAVGQRAAQVVKENIPAATWEGYEKKAMPESLIDSPALMEEMARELGYPDLMSAVSAYLLGNSDQPKTSEVIDVEIEPRADATTITGLTEIRRNMNDQWGDEDDE